jgi:single-strand DNA-binding protein
MTEVTIIGRIGRDAEVKQTREGKNFLSFSVGQTVDYKTDETAWYDVTVWNEKLAQTLSEFVKKGWSVTVVGKMRGIYAKQKPDGSISTSLKVNASTVSVHRSPKFVQEQTSMGSGWNGQGQEKPQSQPQGGGGSQWGQQNAAPQGGASNSWGSSSNEPF